ncbi:tyrosine-type recombinase/integrase [Bartonella krasnovii]|uniref:Integrase arm-type DNA-binding domain-containing protein n=1 Tax=Bartonella krasnovii TaxID=2267275 RepID=A0ABY3W2T6_9HYPH|nr:site-specific integrase [Bartonella krasnovii]UNF29753.1 integrase arm-type DNA-binding domain-containing protein [Bartonella krasnovii]UNF36113.1 integrase arm-type DNA-binding domain-containing protein [Bartonella krasnovii]UNF37768.1 integrase arm-type DNA-binding domain-containing protein [Bartonella krasnovii]UNF39487.1 integrase arm-type DNA-binding domain-containing protein [Bartonella krasnovii]UNF41195.1 integrase arm-type DNA-binding domain-containing protein [Bartonella krasnovii
MTRKTRTRDRLSALSVKNLPKGKYADGAGLWLIKTAQNQGRWVFRFDFNKRRREMGLGSCSVVSLKEARLKATSCRDLLNQGVDPIRKRKNEKLRQAVDSISLREIVLSAFEAKKSELKNEGTAARWLTPLTLHVFPKLGDIAITELTQIDIKECLSPIWKTKNETASKALSRLNIAIKHAVARGINVDMQLIPKAKALLGKVIQNVQNIPAMPWKEVPEFYQSLNDELVSNLALKLLILTGVRSMPIRHIRLEEINQSIWTIPKENMKGIVGKVFDFRVPLTDEALAIIEKAKAIEKNGFLFVGNSGQPISDMTLSKFMKDRGLTYRPHGFRSSLRDWIAETTSTPFEIAEFTLSHSVGNSVTKAYMRTDFLEQRRVLLEQWASFVTGC